MRPLRPLLRPRPGLRLAAARLAMLALLAAALLPGVSRLLQQDAWRALCQAPASLRADATNAPDLPPGGQHGDACAYCTLAHTTPVLAGTPPVQAAVVDYVPPPPTAVVPVRTRVAQSRTPGARAPPSLRPILAARA